MRPVSLHGLLLAVRFLIPLTTIFFAAASAAMPRFLFAAIENGPFPASYTQEARPLEFSVVQPLVEKQKSIAFPEQVLDAVAASAAEQK